MKSNSIADSFKSVLKSILKPVLLIWALFLCVWLFIRFTGLGFQHDTVGLSWGPPGTPITFLQVILVAFISFLLALVWHWIQLKLNGNTTSPCSIRDVLIFIALWGLAVFLWSREPMSPTHFTPPPMPPNHETYPHSDALLFDRSSYHLLYGTGFANQLVRRPLYVGALALFHWIVGGNYDNTIFLQILLLALIPGLVFLVAAKLFNHMAGMIAGGLIVLREENSIALSGEIVTSHAKLMMSDMMATLGVVLVLYLALQWLFKEKPRASELIIVGACLGLTALVRVQALIIFAPLALFIYLNQRSLGRKIKSSLFIFLGIILTMAPWIWRNWNLTGTFVLSDYGEQGHLARNYSLSPVSLPSPLPSETDQQFSARLKADILSFVFSHPGEVVHFAGNHFLRNLATSSVYVAPRYGPDSPSEVVGHLPFWGDWNGDLTRNSRLALVINLGIIALGIAVAKQKNKWVGIFPLAVYLTYSLGNAIARTSGWRFNQPADWIILVYYSVALAYLPSNIKLAFNKNVANETRNEMKDGMGAVIPQALILSALFLLGASVPIAERLIPARDFSSFTNDAKTALTNESMATAREIETFLKQHEAVLLTGIGLYPRYIQPNSRFKPLDGLKDDRDLHFWLINEDDYQIVLPLQNVPEGIPHATMISIIGCREEAYISAIAVIVHEPSDHVLVRSPREPFACPVAPPQ